MKVKKKYENVLFRSRIFAAATASVLFSGSLFAAPALPVINTNNVVVITNTAYGAIGNGVTDNTLAISNAIVKAAAGGVTNGAAGGTVEIPPGIFLSGPITMKSSINLQVDAGAILRMLPFGQFPGSSNANGASINFISASGVNDIEISGSGAIDGQGTPYWHALDTNSAFLRPIMVRFSGCNRQLIQNVTLSNSPMFHLSFSGSKGNITVQGVTIVAPSSSASPQPSHNTDACDVSGTNILVQNCNISVGDDDFTCGGGTSGVLLTNNTYGNGHGISIGSFTDGGVSNITVINCTINGADNGIRIKSDNDRGGLVQNISYLNIGITNVHFPIQIYGYYNEIGTPSSISPVYAATQAVATVSSTTPIYRNITFSNITATSVSGYPIGIIWARTEMPATNIVFKKVHITGDRNFDLYNVSGAQFIDCNLKPSSSTTTFELFNAQFTITNSAPTNTLFTFDGLTTNGYGSSFSFYNAQASLKNTNAFDNGPLTLSASTLTVSNSFTLFPTTVLNYTLGTNTTKLAVVGNLTLGGTNNISADASFTNGTYTLMTYTGSLSGSPPTLGTTPAGYNYSFDTSTAGQVNLNVSTGVITAPAAPTNVVATAGNQTVALSWSPSATANGYNVKRSTTGGGSYAVISGGVTATSYSDTQVTNGTAYYYVVSATNSGGESANSAEVNATPQPGQSNGATANVFSDIFSASTVNSASPSTPTPKATSYEVISAKAWSPTPGISAGHLKFGIGTTASGSIEVQALFTNSPVALSTIGDTLSLTVTFTNTSGLLTQSGAMGFGLYHSGQNYPVVSGMNGTESGASTVNASGNAQTWMGYVGQLAFTGSSSQILTRSPQTGANNNNQDLVTTGGTPSYGNPAGATVGIGSTTPSLTLVAGNPYTEVLTIKLTATNTLAITNQLYSGTDMNGTLLSQFGGVASGGTFLTNAFDALAIGWRETGSQATTIDINQIAVNSTLAANSTTPAPPAAPANLVAQATNLLVNLQWNSVNGATNYNLKRGTADGGPYPTVFSALADTNYADTNVTNAVNYFYVVTAVGAGGESTNSLQAGAIPLPSSQPTNIVMQTGDGQLQLSWPQDHLGWRLQIQTNNMTGGIGTNWTDVPDANMTNQVIVPIDTGNGSVFLRLTYP